MATYKGIALPDRVAPLARHMALLEDHREALARLDATWDTLALLSPLSGLEADAGAIRAEYDALATELLAGIAEASLARVSARLALAWMVASRISTTSRVRSWTIASSSALRSSSRRRARATVSWFSTRTRTIGGEIGLWM